VGRLGVTRSVLIYQDSHFNFSILTLLLKNQRIRSMCSGWQPTTLTRRIACTAPTCFRAHWQRNGGCKETHLHDHPRGCCSSASGSNVRTVLRQMSGRLQNAGLLRRSHSDAMAEANSTPTKRRLVFLGTPEVCAEHFLVTQQRRSKDVIEHLAVVFFPPAAALAYSI
jgi:hypothetical protein